MAKEIERKFLVVSDDYKLSADSSELISQAYLSVRPESTVRVRTAGDRAWLTVKGINHGAERDEWEYQVPVADAEAMIERCALTVPLQKTRWRVGRWEIDEYHGALAPLTVAEIELDSVDEEVDLPAFIGREVTGDPYYYNSSLAASLGKVDPTD
ncbi:CYTH domain-containing protein [Paramuribaculum intestinale]|jgi:adenylate cyclase|uniref:CYTH domain-containing protein n=1 Tax=Paramuribaculum intestinale TaxID=2094151 RepID=UPI000FFE45A2|nr:CYTH domain-containing protein [Paramuribaculum intestinale]RXE62241.1 CYTH domain-containing protein [Muribaculaceae bacterium Isolate-004 (NCI)]